MRIRTSIHKVKNVTITKPEHFPSKFNAATDNWSEPFYAQDVVIESEDGSEMRITVYTYDRPVRFRGVEHATKEHWSGIA